MEETKLIKLKSDDAYRTIGEVADIVGVNQHTLRFWESQFSQVKPHKNNGRRYYSPADIEKIKKIKTLLYDQGLTIKGVKQFIKTNIRENNGADSEIQNLLTSLKYIRSQLLKIND